MSAASPPQNFEIDLAGGPTMFDSLARLVPDELQAAYYRVLAHTRTLSPGDEMLRILEAMGVLALLTRHTQNCEYHVASATTDSTYGRMTVQTSAFLPYFQS